MSQPNPQQEIEEVCEQALIEYKEKLVEKIRETVKYPVYTTTPACGNDEAMLRNTGYANAIKDIINLIKQ